MRIVSLVPSLTELLFDLDLGEAIVGVTRFCIHPETAKQKTKIGGTKSVKVDRVMALKPTLVIANKEENTKEDVEALRKQGIEVWVSDLNTLNDVYAFIEKLGQQLGIAQRANEMNAQIQLGFHTLEKVQQKKVLYLIWHDPIMSIGTDTFIHHLLSLCGYENVIEGTRYPSITEEQLQKLAPDYIFLSSEPYPFKDKHISSYQKLVPQAKIVLVDGEMFSWYGSRLLHAPNYFNILKKQLQ